MTEIEAAIQAVVWPPGADDFSIYPESGKKRNKGNGVRPIRDAFVEAIKNQGWTAELPFPTPTGPGMAKFGDMDASKKFGTDVAVVEWESGNISSAPIGDVGRLNGQEDKVIDAQGWVDAAALQAQVADHLHRALKLDRRTPLQILEDQAAAFPEHDD